MDLLYIWSFTYVWSAYGVLHLLLYCTCISPFLSPFLYYSWVRLFFYDSMAVYVIVVCMYVSVWCGVVWGSSLFSLWIVAGMVVGLHDSGAVCGELWRGQGDCGDAEGLEGAIAGLPTAIS